MKGFLASITGIIILFFYYQNNDSHNRRKSLLIDNSTAFPIKYKNKEIIKIWRGKICQKIKKIKL